MRKPLLLCSPSPICLNAHDVGTSKVKKDSFVELEPLLLDKESHGVGPLGIIHFESLDFLIVPNNPLLLDVENSCRNLEKLPQKRECEP